MSTIPSNLQLKSNLYPLQQNNIRPYEDDKFVQQIMDAEKINKIYKFLPNPEILTQKQKIIREKSAICCYAKEYLNKATSQYFVFSESGKDLCRCQIKQCELFGKCRPNQENMVDEEIREFLKLKDAHKSDMVECYPIQYNFDRMIERYSEYMAFELLSNLDLKKYMTPKQESINFSSGSPNAHWDNWDGGSLDRYYNANFKRNESYVDMRDVTECPENPMFKYQREHNASRK